MEPQNPKNRNNQIWVKELILKNAGFNEGDVKGVLEEIRESREREEARLQSEREEARFQAERDERLHALELEKLRLQANAMSDNTMTKSAEVRIN